MTLAFLIAATSEEGAENIFITLLIGLVVTLIIAFSVLKFGQKAGIREASMIAFAIFVIGALLTLFLAL